MKAEKEEMEGRKERRQGEREQGRKQGGEEGKMDYKLMCSPVHLKNIFKS